MDTERESKIKGIQEQMNIQIMKQMLMNSAKKEEKPPVVIVAPVEVRKSAPKNQDDCDKPTED